MGKFRFGPIEMQARPPRLWLWGRHIHHFWPALLWALTDLSDRRVWIKDLIYREDR